jgi:hypothetical protein
MHHELPFGQVLDAADHLTHEEQEELVAILNRRLSQAARQRIATEIHEARQEFAEGRCAPVSPDDLMREILQ